MTIDKATLKTIQHWATIALAVFIPVTAMMLILAGDLTNVIRAAGFLIGFVILWHGLARPEVPTPRPSWEDYRNAFFGNLPELVDDPTFAGRLADIAVHAQPEPARHQGRR